MTLCTVVWGRKTKIEFVGGQNPVMHSPIIPQNRKIYNGAYGEIFKTRHTFYGTMQWDRYRICPIAVFDFALKHALSLTFKNVIGQQRYQCYQILGHMTIRLAVGGFL